MSPREGAITSNLYVSGDGKQAVLFAFLDHQQFNRPAPLIPLRGLKADAVYKVRTIDNKLTGKEAAFSGAYLMNRGVALDLRGDYDSTAIVFERAE
jgi:alpha-galactosidase